MTRFFSGDSFWDFPGVTRKMGKRKQTNTNGP